MTEFHKWYYCFGEAKLKRKIGIEGFTSLISEKWQPPCLAGNLKSRRCKRALRPALVTFSLKKSYFHFFISSKFCKTPNHQLVSFSFKMNEINIYLVICQWKDLNEIFSGDLSTWYDISLFPCHSLDCRTDRAYVMLLRWWIAI